MTHRLASKSSEVAYRILAIQAFVALLVSALFLLQSSAHAVSALVGGLVCIIPNGVFVLITHRHGGAQAAKKVINAFYLAEATKLMLTALLFALVFILLSVKVLPLFTAYIACLLSYFSQARSLPGA